MVMTARADCREFLTTWVDSGSFVSQEPGSVPSEVHDATPVPGLHLIHTAPALDGLAVVVQTLLTQPLSVVARMVDAPPASVAAALTLDGAIARTGTLGLPVLVTGNALAGAGSDRVLPIDIHGRPATPDTAEYVLVLPAVHLFAKHPSIAGTGADLDLPAVLAGEDRDVVAAATSFPGPPVPAEIVPHAHDASAPVPTSGPAVQTTAVPRPWVTIDFDKKKTHLSGVPHQLAEAATWIASEASRGLRIDVFVEGGGSGSGGLFGMAVGANDSGAARAITVHTLLRSLLAGGSENLVLHPPISRGAGESVGPKGVISQQNQRQALVWWHRRLPPTIEPITMSFNHSGSLSGPMLSALSGLARSVVESSLDGSLELVVTGANHYRINAVLANLMPQVMNSLREQGRPPGAVTVSKGAPALSLTDDTVLIHARLQRLAAFTPSDLKIVTAVNNILLNDHIPQTPAAIIEAADRLRMRHRPDRVAGVLAENFRNEYGTQRLRGGTSFNDWVRGTVGSALVSHPSAAPVGSMAGGGPSVVSSQLSGRGLELLDQLRRDQRQRQRRPGWQGQPPEQLPLWGPDPFGLRDIPPKPDFMPPPFRNFDVFRTDVLVELFSRLDLTVAHRPVKINSITSREQTVWQSPTVKWMGPLAEATERDRTAMPVAEMPMIVHTFWYGSPLDGLSETTLAFQRTIAESAKNADSLGFATVLWTTVTREQFRSPDSSVGRMRRWAQLNSILLINVHEIFNSSTPMQLMSEFQLALSKGTPGGYAEAKDISLPEILYRFGGIGIDGDNVLRETSALIRLFKEHGFALERFRKSTQPLQAGTVRRWGFLNNSSMMLARKHPVAKILSGLLQENYTRRLDEMNPGSHRIADDENAQIEYYVKKRSRHLARSITERSGPPNIERLARAIGHDGSSLPAITQKQISTGFAHTWIPELHPRSQASGDVDTRAVQEPVLPALQRAVTYLIRELRNRKGDLHLLAVEPLITDLPDPAAAWEAVVGFLLASPDISGPIRTATYSHFVNLNMGNGELAIINLHTIELPRSVREALGIPEQPREARGTRMSRGAFQVPVKARYQPWQLTIEFSKKRTDLDGIPSELAEMVNSVAANLRHGFQVDVFVEGGGNGSVFGLGRGSQDTGKARATAVHSLLEGSFREVTDQVILHPPFSRGPEQSAGPGVVGASDESRRRVAVWWSRRLPPRIDPVELTVGPDGSLPASTISTLRTLASAVVESSADGALELQVAGTTRVQVRAVLKQLMPEVSLRLPDHKDASAVTVAELGPPDTLPRDTVLIRTRLQPLVPLGRADQDMVTAINNKLLAHGIPQTPAVILEVAKTLRHTNETDHISAIVGYFLDVHRPFRLRGGARYGEQIRAALSALHADPSVVAKDNGIVNSNGEIGSLAPPLTPSQADLPQADVEADSAVADQSASDLDVKTVTAPSWPLRLTGGPLAAGSSPRHWRVTAHGDVYVISSNEENTAHRMIAELVPMADAEHPVILLDTPGVGTAPQSADIATLNYLLEQFAQRRNLPVVVTRGGVSLDLLTVTDTYGVAILHPTTKKSDTSRLTLDTSHRWRVTPHRTDPTTLDGTLHTALAGENGQSTTPTEIIDVITPDVLRREAKKAQKNNPVAPVDGALAELIWAKDLKTSKDVFQRLRARWSAEQMKANLTEVEQMIDRVPNQPELSVFAPVLKLGAVGHEDVVFDYATADETQRPKVLLDSVGRLDTAGQLNTPVDVDGGLTTGQLADMVTKVGVTDISAPVLTVIGEVKAGNFEDANAFIEANRGKLTVTQKQQWVDAIADLRQTMTNKDAQLRILAQGVLNC
ncbi:hypothetical protein [Micromonospora sp. NPDC049102]|uniref:hypothetical protein n=1 Tax=Micromonospora sp. NPDC049102 TaxID=3364265 RepID=UPI0037137A7E